MCVYIIIYNIYIYYYILQYIFIYHICVLCIYIYIYVCFCTVCVSAIEATFEQHSEQLCHYIAIHFWTHGRFIGTLTMACYKLHNWVVSPSIPLAFTK